jgi:hypothetical protein
MRVIDIQTYNYKLHLSIGDDYKKVVQNINKRVKKHNIKLPADVTEQLKDAIEDKNALAFFINLGINGSGLIGINPIHADSLSPITISHEVIHACIDIFENIGSDVNKETEEPFCYLHDFLMEECLKEIDKVKNGNNIKAHNPTGVVQKLD